MPHIFRPLKNGLPHAPTPSNAPKRMTASMLMRPCRDQYASGLRFSQSANSSSVKRRARSITDSHQPAKEDRDRRVRAAQIDQPSIAHQQQDEDAPHQVVNVRPAHHHPLEHAFVSRNPVDQDAHAYECEQKRNRGEEHALPRPVRYCAPHQEPQPGQLQSTSRTMTTRLTNASNRSAPAPGICSPVYNVAGPALDPPGS